MRSPFTKEQLRPLDPRCRVVQFSSLPDKRDLIKLASFLEDYPHVALRAYGGYDGSITDLDFLTYFPNVRRFFVDALFELTNIDGLEALRPDLEQLGLGRTRRRLSLSPLARFGHLERLFIEGHTKTIEVVATLTSLKKLSLRSITLPDLEFLIPLINLRSFALRLGGTTDLSHLSQIGQLEYLELWMIRGLSDITCVAEMPTLRYVFLQTLKHVSEIPSLRPCSALVRLHLESMKSVTQLQPIADAPRLQELMLIDMPQLKADAVRVLAGHRDLRAITIGTGSRRRNEELKALLGLPGANSLSADLRELRT